MKYTTLIFYTVILSAITFSDVVNTQSVQVWLTTLDQTYLFQRLDDINFSNSSTFNNHQQQQESKEEQQPTILTVTRYEIQQRVYGYGAALTQSSAYLFSMLLNENQTNGMAVLRSLFDPVDGIGLNMIRVPASACDFSLSNYTYDDFANDTSLKQLSIDVDKQYTIPIIKLIQSINPDIKLVYSPWTAPKWMKDSNEYTYGELLPNMYDVYTDFFVSFLSQYKQEVDIDIFAITLQNEPLFQPYTYPGMSVPASVELELVKLLGPKLVEAKLDTRIYIYDHNWNNIDYALEILADSEAYNYVSAIAFHCYAGDVSNQTIVKNKYPEKEIHMTECSGGYWAPNFSSDLTWNTQNLYMGAIQNWGNSVMLWNLALDTNDGPTNHGCLDCRGLLTVTLDSNNNTNNPQQHKQNEQQPNNIEFNVEYYGLAHFSKFIFQPSFRIPSAFENNTYGTCLNCLSILNGDGSIHVVVLNSCSNPIDIQLQYGENYFNYQVPVGLITFRWLNE